jgi:hypothetical protein
MEESKILLEDISKETALLLLILYKIPAPNF